MIGIDKRVFKVIKSFVCVCCRVGYYRKIRVMGAVCLNICLNVIVLWCQSLTKTVTIRDEVYKKLLTVKRKDESFSKLFERLVEGTNPVENLMKLRGCVEFKDKEKMLLEINTLRSERRL